MSDPDLSRRRFLQSAALAAGVPLLAACAPPVAAPSATRPPAGAPTTAATGDAVFPTYVPVKTGPKPDFPASGPTYDDAFSSYPSNPAFPGQIRQKGSASTAAAQRDQGRRVVIMETTTA